MTNQSLQRVNVKSGVQFRATPQSDNGLVSFDVWRSGFERNGRRGGRHTGTDSWATGVRLPQ